MISSPAGHRNKILAACLILFCAAMLIINVWHRRVPKVNQDCYWNTHDFSMPVLRAHVTAHSSSPEEEQLKMEVQRELYTCISLLGDTASITSFADLVSNISRALPRLTERLQKLVEQKGCDHQVEVRLEKKDFPFRHYGNRLYPPGEYTALSVTIGEGEGENWWCLLYPPLCFPASEVNQDSDPEKNGNSPSGKEAPQICSDNDGDAERGFWQRWRLKIADWLF